MAFEYKDKYTIGDLREIMTLLRSENGCPWDKVQTHESIRSNMIEEAYEVIEAIDNKDLANMREELGDVLLQVVFHSEMEREAGNFDFDDVCDEVCKKLITRHPHVFGNVVADTPEEVLKNWELIKAGTKGRKTATDSINSIPRSLPALMRAAKVQKKASDAGFDWRALDEGAFDKIAEELEEVRDAIDEGDKAHIDDELGDLFFATVNVCRFVHTDPEQALTAATDKFAKRFAITERLASERGIDMKTSGIDVLDELWDAAKAELKAVNGIGGQSDIGSGARVLRSVGRLKRSIPASKGGYSGSKVGYSGSKVGYSGGKDGYSGGKDGYSGGKDGYSGGKDRYSGGKDRYSGGKDSGKSGYSSDKGGITSKPAGGKSAVKAVVSEQSGEHDHCGCSACGHSHARLAVRTDGRSLRRVYGGHVIEREPEDDSARYEAVSYRKADGIQIVDCSELIRVRSDLSSRYRDPARKYDHSRRAESKLRENRGRRAWHGRG